MSAFSHTWLTFRTVGAGSSRSLFIAATGVSLKYGGSPSTISTTMIPIDQISTWCINIQSKLGRKSHSMLCYTENDRCCFSARLCLNVPHHLGAIWWFGDDFRSHPIGCSHQRLPFRDVLADLSTEAKVWELDLWRIKGRLCYQDHPRAKERKEEAKAEMISIPFHL